MGRVGGDNDEISGRSRGDIGEITRASEMRKRMSRMIAWSVLGLGLGLGLVLGLVLELVLGGLVLGLGLGLGLG